MRKVCITCKVEKDISEFYTHSRMADGHLNKCKECCKKHSNERRVRKLEEIREYDRNRPNKEERNEKAKVYRQKMKKENPEKYNRIYGGIRKRYRERHPEIAKAEGLLNEALRTGKIVRPSKCCQCGKGCKPEAHHYDYNKPFDVMWVCAACHSRIHKGVNDLIRIA